MGSPPTIVARTADDLTRYHSKMMVIDDTLYVLGFNYTRLDIEKSRSFGVITADKRYRHRRAPRNRHAVRARGGGASGHRSATATVSFRSDGQYGCSERTPSADFTRRAGRRTDDRGRGRSFLR